MTDVDHGSRMQNPHAGEPDYANACLVLALAGAIKGQGVDAGVVDACLEGLVDAMRPQGGSEVMMPAYDSESIVPELNRSIERRIRACAVLTLTVFVAGKYYHTFHVADGDGISIAINLVNWNHWVERRMRGNNGSNSVRSSLIYSRAASLATIIADGQLAAELHAEELAAETARMYQIASDHATAATLHAADVAVDAARWQQVETCKHHRGRHDRVHHRAPPASTGC
jgi:hypothetical protein